MTDETTVTPTTTKEQFTACVHAIRDAIDTDAQETAALELLETVSHDVGVRQWKWLFEADIVEVMTAAVWNLEDGNAKEDCVDTVTILVRGNQDKQRLFADAGILKPLVAFLSYKSERGLPCAARALYALLDSLENYDTCQMLRDVDGSLEALEALKDSSASAKCMHDYLRFLPKTEKTGAITKAARTS